MKCPSCRRTLYSLRPRCEHCGETLPAEYLIPDPQEEALKAEIEEIKARIAKTRAETAKEEKERAARHTAFVPPPSLPPPGC